MPDGLIGLGGVGPRGAGIVTLPNAVTFMRLCAVPVAVWLALHERLATTFVVFAGAGVSDALDGWLARRRGGSALGAVLDPLADKALLVSMFVVLALIGILPAWLVIVAVVRDVLIVGGLLALWRFARPVRVRPLAISKLNTALQLLLIGVALLLHGFGLHADAALQALIWVVTGTTLASGAAYAWRVARGGKR